MGYRMAGVYGALLGGGTPSAPAIYVYRFDGDLTEVNGKDLEVFGEATAAYSTGKFSQGLGSLAGGGSFSVGRTQDLLTGDLNTASYSVSFWTKQINSANEKIDVQFRNAASDILFHVIAKYRTSAGGGMQNALVGFNNDAVVSASSYTFIQNAWTHIAVSVSGGFATIWINGVVKTSTLAVPSGLTFDPAGSLEIAIAPNAVIDDLGIKPAILTQSDVDAIYAAGAGTLYPAS